MSDTGEEELYSKISIRVGKKDLEILKALEAKYGNRSKANRELIRRFGSLLLEGKVVGRIKVTESDTPDTANEEVVKTPKSPKRIIIEFG